MKKLILFLSPCLIASVVHAKRICLDIPDDEIALVETYVPNAEQWIREAWAGKVNDRKKALMKDQIDYSLEHQIAIPADPDQIVQDGMERLGSRKEREEKETEK